MEVSESALFYAQLPDWLMCIHAAVVEQEEKGRGIRQKNELVISQGKAPSHHTLFGRKVHQLEKPSTSRRNFKIRGHNMGKKDSGQ